MRRILTPLALATIMALSAQLALGAAPVHDKFVVDETFPDNVCGIDVTTHLEIKGNVLIFSDGARVIDASRIVITWTNAAGVWLENFVRGPGHITEELNGDILTVTVRATGIQERLRSAEGISAAFDRGQITIEQVIDLNDLENPDDDVFLSFTILSQHGPHPEADSDFTLFCEVVTEILG
jgi:hypothetical protein